MNLWTAVCLLALVSVMLASCKSMGIGSLAKSQEQAKLESVTAAAREAAAARGDVVLADFLANVPKSGASGFTLRDKVVRDPTTGQPVLDQDGYVQYEKVLGVGLVNSMREIGGLQTAYLMLGGQAINPITGDIKPGPYVNGLFLYFTGQIESKLDSEFAAVWADAPAKEKQAAAEAVAKGLTAWKGLIVEGVTAGGQQITGILKEVIKATPAGAASAAVDVLIEAAGKTTPATITAPFVSLPTTAATDASTKEASAAVPPSK